MTIFGITLSAAVVWLVIAGLLAIIEAFTLGLTTIWFAGGAVAASISAMFGAGTVVQVIVFLVVSIILLAVTSQVVKRKLNSRTQKTNADALIGQEGIVEEDIFPYTNGQVNGRRQNVPNRRMQRPCDKKRHCSYNKKYKGRHP